MTLLTVEQAATRLGTTDRFIRRLRTERRIPVVKLGKHIRIDSDDLERLHPVQPTRSRPQRVLTGRSCRPCPRRGRPSPASDAIWSKSVDTCGPEHCRELSPSGLTVQAPVVGRRAVGRRWASFAGGGAR